MITFNICLNEIRRIWLQPLVWVVLGITFVVIALLFLVLLNNFYSETQVKYAGLPYAPGVTDAVIYPMLFWSTLIGALMIPIFTLRLITEEKIRQQHILLSSAPVSCRIIIFSKLCALLSVILSFSLLTLAFPATIENFVDLDWGKIFSGIIGMIFFQVSFAAACVWIATLSKSLIFTLLSCLGFFIFSFVLFFSGASESSSSSLFLYLSNFSHVLAPLSGLISSQDIFYFILITLLFSALAVIQLRFKRD